MSKALRAVCGYTNRDWAKYRIAKDVWGSSESVVVGHRHQSRYLITQLVADIGIKALPHGSFVGAFGHGHIVDVLW